jgi:ABC-2 type transport system ATP-binding protein
MAKAPAISIQNLSFGYRHFWTLKKKICLHPFSLDINENEVFGFLGHNGAGKTTTIKCLLGLVTPFTGCTQVFGVDSRIPKARATIGYVPEHPYFYHHLTALETMQLYATLAGVSSNESAEAIKNALAEVHFDAPTNRPLRMLSKGQMQRVAMAQALVANPKVLILDEPFSGLDPEGRKQFVDLLYHRKQQGCTIFLCSHILSDVQALCDRVSIMKQGKLKGVFDINNLPASQVDSLLVIELPTKANSELSALADRLTTNDRFLRLEFKSADVAQKALSLAVAAGAKVDMFQTIQPSLEDVFTKIMEEQPLETSDSPQKEAGNA